MNLKLTGLREVLGGPSDPGGFVHNFIFEKIRLMRKKSLLRLKNRRIFYISPSLKMLKNALGLHFRGANVFHVSYGFAFFIYRLSVYRNTFHKLIWGVNNASENFRGL